MRECRLQRIFGGETVSCFNANGNYFRPPVGLIASATLARRTQRNPSESIVRQTSVNPASSQLRADTVQFSPLLDHAPPRNTRFSPSAGPRGFSRGLVR